jgi:ubiquinone/menaquinone biosynthesis C-methylase UbiE
MRKRAGSGEGEGIFGGGMKKSSLLNHFPQQTTIMKGTLNWQHKEVVNIFDEVNLWSAPFGRLLLENIPMAQAATVLDIGFGTGFPLIELSQRFGETSQIYGIDIWKEAIIRTKEKIRVLKLNNIEIFEQSAEKIPLPDNEIDLICSNLGVNNFENKEEVFRECHRVLKPNGHFCISTNPVGTFSELFTLFEEILLELKQDAAASAFREYVQHRETKESIEKEVTAFGFTLTKSVSDKTNIRFVNSMALLNHGLIRIGFLESWQNIVPEKYQNRFFEALSHKIDGEIKRAGAFSISIPMLYIEFMKA